MSWTGTLIFVLAYPLDSLIFNQVLTTFELLLVIQDSIMIMKVEIVLTNQEVFEMYYDDEPEFEHGGKRWGAGRKKDWISNFGIDDRKPRSVYCGSEEIEQVKTFLYRKRAIRILQNYEPLPQNANHYAGTHEEWERDYESVRYIDLEKVSDMRNRVEAILKKCLRDDD